MATYVGEIKMFAGNFAPVGWAFCNGQLLPINEYDVLFHLIGTTYGGDGNSTFGLPDLRGRVPLHVSSSYVLSEAGGREQVTLTSSSLPSHHHLLRAAAGPAAGLSDNPEGNVLAAPTTVDLYGSGAPPADLNSGMVSPMGGSQPHTNMQPFLAISFIIAVHGIYPSIS